MRKPGERVSQIGEFWLSHDPKSPDIWCITWYDAKKRQTRRRSTGLVDLAAAEIELARWVVQNTELKEERPEDIQISVVLDRYWEKHAKALTSANSAGAGINRWKEFWKDDPISGLTLERQNEFEKWLRALTYTRGKSPVERSYAASTIVRYWNIGPTALEWARNAHEIKYYPAVRFMNDDTRRDRILSLDEAASLFNAAIDTEHLWRWLLLSFGTAARPNAPLELMIGPPMIDLEHHRLNLLPPGRIQNPKKRKPVLPIVPTLLPWIRHWTSREQLIHRGKRGKVVDITRLITFRGKPIRQIGQGFEKLKRRAGIADPKVIPYTIRHTMTTWFMTQRTEEWDREVWLGHREPGSKTTAGYIHLDPDYLQSAAEATDAYFRQLMPLVKRPIGLLGLAQNQGKA